MALGPGALFLRGGGGVNVIAMQEQSNMEAVTARAAAGAERHLSPPQPGNETTSLVLLIAYVVVIIMVFMVGIVLMGRMWLIRKCCGEQFAERFNSSMHSSRVDQQQQHQQQQGPGGGIDNTVLVHDGRVFQLSEYQRRAVLETIFGGPETTRAAEEVVVDNKKKRKRKRKKPRKRQSDNDNDQVNGVVVGGDDDEGFHHDHEDDSVSRDEDLPDEVVLPRVLTGATDSRSESSPLPSITETLVDETETTIDNELGDTSHTQQKEQQDKTQPQEAQSSQLAHVSGLHDSAELDSGNRLEDTARNTDKSHSCGVESSPDEEVGGIIGRSALVLHQPSPSPALRMMTQSPVHSIAQSISTFGSAPEDSCCFPNDSKDLQDILRTPITTQLEIYRSESQLEEDDSDNTSSCIGKSNSASAVAAAVVVTTTANDAKSPSVSDSASSSNNSNGSRLLDSMPDVGGETTTITKRSVATEENDSSLKKESNKATSNTAEVSSPTLPAPAAAAVAVASGDDSLELPTFQPVTLRRKKSFPIPEDMSIDENATSSDDESKMERKSLDDLTEDGASVASAHALENPRTFVRRDSFATVTSFATVMSEYTTDGDSTDGNCCPICLNGYGKGDTIIISKYCTHMFHKDCIFEWLEKHDDCPICRSTMMTDTEVSKAATKVIRRSHLFPAMSPRQTPYTPNNPYDPSRNDNTSNLRPNGRSLPVPPARPPQATRPQAPRPFGDISVPRATRSSTRASPVPAAPSATAAWADVHARRFRSPFGFHHPS